MTFIARSFLARFAQLAAVASAAVLVACGGGGGGGGGAGPGPTITDAGFLKLALTDAPACGYDHINVTVLKVRVHPSSSAADGDPGWSEVVLSPAQRIDLRSLINGAVVELGQVTLPVGTYRQMSLVLAANDATTPLANAVTPVARAETALASPASLQSGLKLAVAIDIAKDQVADYVLDFDGCNSVRRLGQTGNYDLSPSYTIVRRVSATGQRVTGFVAPQLDPATTRVSVQSNGTVVRSTSPDSTGHFVLYPVPAGTYDVVVSNPGRVAAVVTGVPVADTTSTDLASSAAPIDPPVSLTHTVTGTVSTGATPVDATIRVVKKYAGGPNVVVAGAPADASTGGLAYTLANGPAVRAPFTANNATLQFSVNGSAPAGAYTITATAGGVVKSADVDATNGDPAPVAFTFP